MSVKYTHPFYPEQLVVGFKIYLTYVVISMLEIRPPPPLFTLRMSSDTEL